MEGEEAFKELLLRFEEVIETATRRRCKIETLEARNRELGGTILGKDKEIKELQFRLESEERKHSNLQAHLNILEKKVEMLNKLVDNAEEDEIDKPEVLEALNEH